VSTVAITGITDAVRSTAAYIRSLCAGSPPRCPPRGQPLRLSRCSGPHGGYPRRVVLSRSRYCHLFRRLRLSHRTGHRTVDAGCHDQASNDGENHSKPNGGAAADSIETAIVALFCRRGIAAHRSLVRCSRRCILVGNRCVVLAVCWRVMRSRSGVVGRIGPRSSSGVFGPFVCVASSSFCRPSSVMRL